jgi:hypothetical protein
MKLLYFFFFFIISFSLCSYDRETKDLFCNQEIQRNLLEQAEGSNNEEEDDYTEMGKSLYPVLFGLIDILKMLVFF